MTLSFRLWARGLAITLTAILLSGCTSFSTLFQSEPLTVEDQTSKQQRLGTIQLRVARTALAHRDYDAAIGLFEEAAHNQTIRHSALLGLGKLYELTSDHKAALTTYRRLLKENPSNIEARVRLRALSAQTAPKSAQNQAIGALNSHRTLKTQPRPAGIDVRSNLSKATQPVQTSKSTDPRIKFKRQNITKKQVVKAHGSEKRFTIPHAQLKATNGAKKRAFKAAVSDFQRDHKVFRVQLAAFRYKSNAVRALKQFNTIIAANQNLFALLTRSERGNDQKGIHYRIRTKTMITASVAKNLCEKVRSAGHHCLVILHNQTMWRSSA